MKNKENHPLAPLAFILQTDFKMLKIIGVVAPHVRMRTPFVGVTSCVGRNDARRVDLAVYFKFFKASSYLLFWLLFDREETNKQY